MRNFCFLVFLILVFVLISVGGALAQPLLPDKNLVWAYAVDKGNNYGLLSAYPPERLDLPMTLLYP